MLNDFVLQERHDANAVVNIATLKVGTHYPYVQAGHPARTSGPDVRPSFMAPGHTDRKSGPVRPGHTGCVDRAPVCTGRKHVTGDKSFACKAFFTRNVKSGCSVHTTRTSGPDVPAGRPARTYG